METEDLLRYGRQLLLPQLEKGGQQKLKNSRVLVVGAGGLGAPVLLYLAAAGVGYIEFLDDDEVDISNLHRQVLHTLGDLGRPKAHSAKRELDARFSGAVEVVGRVSRLEREEAEELFRSFDLVVDATDNFVTRYLISDAAAEVGVPVVWGAVLGFDAQVSVFADGLTLRDVHSQPPPESNEPFPVFGALVGQAGTIMAMEAVKVLAEFGEPLVGRLLVIDALRAKFHEIPVVRRR